MSLIGRGYSNKQLSEFKIRKKPNLNSQLRRFWSKNTKEDLCKSKKVASGNFKLSSNSKLQGKNYKHVMLS